MVTKAFVDFNGIVVEKYDVTRPVDPHKVDAEYGSKQKPGALRAKRLSPGPSKMSADSQHCLQIKAAISEAWLKRVR